MPARPHHLRISIPFLTTLALALALTVTLTHLASAQPQTQPNLYTITPEPTWATPLPVTPPTTTPTADLTNGVYYYLRDEFHRVATEESYGHFARQIVSETGVQNGSEIRIVIDPEYETLELHKVDVLRDGTWRPRLTPDIVSSMRRETDLEDFVIDGTYTVVIRLTDIRPGDIFRYSFTRRGENPVMKGHFYDSLTVALDEPVQTIRSRVETTPDKPLHIRRHGTDLEPTRTGNLLEWRVDDPPIVQREDDVPRWVNVYPWIEISDMATWSEVVNWAIPLFNFQQPIPPALEAEIARIAQEPNPTAQTAAALRFVQDQIRYLGEETGINSHQPRSPTEVFTKRFGDCKEKLTLFGTILDRIGINVHPVLVNTDWEKSVADFIPSPYAFNHVIAEVELPTGNLILDPTRTQQRGPLNQLFIPPYGFGLRVAVGESTLREIQPRPESLGKTQVQQTFTVPADTNPTPATLTLVTTTTGYQAEKSRRWMADSGARALQKQYLDYYAKDYPGIETKVPLTFEDDPVTNTFVIRETYEITAFWKEDAENPLIQNAEFHQPDLESQLTWPAKTRRKWPFDLPWPRDYQIRTTINLPEAWPDDAQNFRERNPWFDFTYTTHSRGPTVTIDGHYQALVRSIPTDDIEKYQTAARKSWDAVWYAASSDQRLGDSPPWKLNLWMLAAMLATVIGSSVAARRLFRRTSVPPPLPTSPPTPRYQAIGGWLYLLGFGVIVTPLSLIPIVATDVLPSLNQHAWDALVEGENIVYTWIFGGLYAASPLVFLALLVFHVALIPLFIGRYRLFPATTIALTTASISYAVVVAVCLAIVSDEVKIDSSGVAEIVASIISAAIWIPYLLISKRVRATFVR